MKLFWPKSWLNRNCLSRGQFVFKVPGFKHQAFLALGLTNHLLLEAGEKRFNFDDLCIFKRVVHAESVLHSVEQFAAQLGVGFN